MWVPVVVPNRRNKGYRNRAGGGIFAAVILLLVFGFLAFFFFNSFDGFVMPIWFIISGFGVFLIIIVVIAFVFILSLSYKSGIFNVPQLGTTKGTPNKYHAGVYPLVFRHSRIGLYLILL